MRRAPRLILVSFLLPALLVPVLSGTSSATSHCRTSGPSGAAWSVTVCITAPAGGATLSGSEAVTATAIASDGRKVKWLQFFLDEAYVLTDYQKPFEFSLPTDRWVDAPLRTLAAQAVVNYAAGTWTSARADVAVAFDNGVTDPPPRPRTFVPYETDPRPGDPLVVAAVGDGADGRSTSDDVLALIESWDPDMALYLGDVYGRGTYTEFENWFGPGGYGRFASIMNPTPGNHEYETPDADGYFDFWVDPPHYYSFDAGDWHFVSLDSTAQFDQTVDGTPQYDWLQADLAASDASCTLAFWHHSAYTLASDGGTSRMRRIWALLANNGADVVLGGHDHNYVRWKPLDASGSVDSAGTTEFVVGTGGHYLYPFERSDGRVARAVEGRYGALRLELLPESASYEWVDSNGSTGDSGAIDCAPDTTPPSPPDGFNAWAVSSSRIDMSWGAATDDRAVSGYHLFRNGSPLATVGSGTLSYSDTGLASATTYTYAIEAFDASGNVSGRLSDVVTTPGYVFADGFETGDLSRWTEVNGLTVGKSPVFHGTYAARATGSGTPAFARKTLSAGRPDLYGRVRFKPLSQGANGLDLIRFLAADGTGLVTVFLTSGGQLATKNEVTLQSKISTTTAKPGSGWHLLQLHVSVNGASSLIEVWLGGTKVSFLSGSASLGTAPVGRVQVGEHATGRTFDVAFDDYAVDTSRV